LGELSDGPKHIELEQPQQWLSVISRTVGHL
jgi:hypothetical protein